MPEAILTISVILLWPVGNWVEYKKKDEETTERKKFAMREGKKEIEN